MNDLISQLTGTLRKKVERKAVYSYGTIDSGSVVRDSKNNVTGAKATVDGISNQIIQVPYGTPLSEGTKIKVRLVEGETIQPIYELVRIVESSQVVVAPDPTITIPTPSFVTTSQWTSTIDNASGGGTPGGMTCTVLVKWNTIDHQKYNVVGYEIRYKKSSDANWAIPFIGVNTNDPTPPALYAGFVDMSIGTNYDFMIRATGFGGNVSAWSSITTYLTGPDDTAPTSPSLIGLSVSYAPGQIILDWVDNTEYDRAGYFLYYNTVNSFTKGVTPRINITQSRCVFEVGTPLTAYYFAISCYDSSNNESYLSASTGPYTVPSTPYPPGTKPSTPTWPISGSIQWSPYVINGTSVGQISVDWNDVTDFVDSKAGYVVYLQTGDPAQPWTGSYTGVSNYIWLALKPSTRYSVKVRAIDRYGRISDESTEKTLLVQDTISDTTAPGVPQSLAADFTGSDLTLTWSRPLTNYEDLRDYEIKIYDTSGGALRRTIWAGNSTSAKYTYVQNVADTGGNGDPSLYIEVKAYDTSNNASTAATISAVNLAPNNVSGLTSQSWFKGVFFQWTPNTDKDLKGYQVRTKISSGAWGSWTSITDNSYVRQLSASEVSTYGISAIVYIEVVAEDIFGQTSVTAASVNNTGVDIQPVDMSGSIFQIIPSDSDSNTDSTLSALFDGVTTSGGVVYTVLGTDKYIQYEFPVEHTFNQVLVWASAAANVYIAVSRDSATWTWLAGVSSLDHGLSSGKLVSKVDQTTAQSDYWTIASGKNQAQFPSMVRAKYVRFYLRSSVTIYELKWWTYLLADEIVGGDLKLERGITIANNNSTNAVSVDNTGMKCYITTDSATSFSMLDGYGLWTKYNNTEQARVGQLDSTHFGIWGNIGGFGGTGFADRKITIDSTGLSMGTDTNGIKIGYLTNGYYFRGIGNGSTQIEIKASDGKLYAGNETVTLGANGVSIDVPVDSQLVDQSYKFVSGGATLTSFSTWKRNTPSPAQTFTWLQTNATTGYHNQFNISVNADTNKIGILRLTADNSSSQGTGAAQISLLSNSGGSIWACSPTAVGFAEFTFSISAGTSLYIPNNLWFSSRNAANNADITIIKVDTNDRIQIGGALYTAGNIYPNNQTLRYLTDDGTYLKSNDTFLSGGALRATTAVYPGNDGSYYLQMQSGSPVVAFDNNDYMLYDRTNNILEIYIGSTRRAYCDTTGWHAG